MWAWIASGLMLLISIWFFVMAGILLYGKSDGFGISFNPVLEDGRRKYNKQKHRRSSGITMLVIAIVVALPALALMAEQIWPGLPRVVIMIAFYIMGAMLVIALTANAVYLDTCCQEKTTVTEQTE